jgi:hypothetical protein
MCFTTRRDQVRFVEACSEGREWFEAVYLFYDTIPKEQGRGIADVRVETIDDDIPRDALGDSETLED